MNIRIFKFAVLVLAFFWGPFAANADPVVFEGHHYEVVVDFGTDWATAETDAEGMVFAGVNGHLATLTSAAEDAFVDQLRQDTVDDEELSREQFWIGGFQPDGESAPGDGWQWLNSEGSIPGVDSVSPYANWGDNNDGSDIEPNDGGGGRIMQKITLRSAATVKVVAGTMKVSLFP